MELASKLSTFLSMLKERARLVVNRRSWSYQPLKQETTNKEYKIKDLSTFKRQLRLACSVRRFLTLILLGVTLLAALLFLFISKHGAAKQSPHRQEDHILRLLVPNSILMTEMCKTVLTAGILGYPTIQVVNYHQDLDLAGREIDREKTKMAMLKNWFDKVSDSSDGDIVIVLDTPYSWFQLRPEVLLSRYHELNHKANARLRKRYGADEVAFGGTKQSIVMSSRQGLWHSGSLEFLAESAFAGSHSSSDPEHVALPAVGTIMGPIRNMRALFRAAHARSEYRAGRVSTSNMLAEILDQQEKYRNRVHRRDSSWMGRSWRAVSKRLDYRRRRNAQPAQPQTVDSSAFEFELGLDHDNMLGLPVANEESASYVARGASTVADMQLPSDIEASMPPYWTPKGNHRLHTKGWSDISLVAHADTKVVPAIVNFPWNTTIFQKSQWTDFWMTPDARNLYDEMVEVPRLPVASVFDSTGIEHTYWDASVRFDRSGVRTIDDFWAKWDDYCGGRDTWYTVGLDA